jgi:flagellin
MPISFNGGAAVYNAQRRVGQATAELGKSFEKLSSGMRINRASDDAAGLAIADGLQNLAKLYNVAARNLSDGLSLTTIAAGGLSDQLGILSRLGELAEQSSSENYSASQRSVMNKEYSALMLEYNRIAQTTEFNDLRLLIAGQSDSLGTSTIQAGVTGSSNSQITVSGANTGALIGNVILNPGDYTEVGGASSTPDGSQDANDFIWFINALGTGRFTDEEKAVIGNGQEFAVQLSDGSIGSVIFTGWDFAGGADSRAFLLDSTGRIVTSETFNTGFAGPADKSSLFNGLIDISQLNFYQGTLVADPANTNMAYGSVAPTGEIANVIGGTTVTSIEQARRALELITATQDAVAAALGRYGAAESRIRSGLALVSSMREAATTAEARIRSVDFAEESARAVSLRIKQEAATAVLAQASQRPQIALQLLQ